MKNSPETRHILADSQRICRENKHASIEPEHILLSMRRNEAGAELMRKLDVNLERIAVYCTTRFKSFKVGNITSSDSALSHSTERVIRLAETLPAQYKKREVEPIHLLYALCEEISSTLPKESGLSKAAVRNYIRASGSNIKIAVTSGGARKPMTDTDGSILEQCSVDLTQRAAELKLGPIIGRTDELRRVIQVLCRSGKNNPVLLGKGGVGKNSIVEALAIRISDGDVPLQLRGKRLLTLDISSIIAGASLRGQFEERMKRLIGEIKALDGQIILFVNDLSTLVSNTEGSTSDVSGLIKPALSRGEIQMLAASTPEHFRKTLEKDKAMDRLFQQISVEEPTTEQTLSILRGIKRKYESAHRVKISDAALNSAITLSKRYIPARNLPDKAIDLIDEAASRLRIELDGMPHAIDMLQRQVNHLKMEDILLGEQTQSESALETRASNAIDLRKAEASLKELTERWKEEQTLLQSIQSLTERIEHNTRAQDDAERSGAVAYAAQVSSENTSLSTALNEGVSRLTTLREKGRLLREDILPEDVAAVVADITGIPVNSMMQSEKDKLINMEVEVGKRVIGQKEALEAVSKSVRRSRAGLNDPNRPVGSFFFLGPSGVGKTELAKSLTQFLFEDESNLVRFDMSEFMEKHAVARLIGAPPGYKGSDEGGQLTEAVRLKPYSVILFDEVEKGHPDVFNVLLQILDDGRLTDSKGQLVDFKNTVIVMTSNVGSEHLLSSTLKYGLVKDEAKEKAMSEMRKSFRPEFLGRIDEIIFFHGLTKENLKQIADIQIRKIDKLLDAKKLSIEFTEEAKTLMVNLGYDPAYGARPLRNAMQRHIQDPLSLEILRDKFSVGDTILVDVAADTFTFEVARR